MHHHAANEVTRLTFVALTTRDIGRNSVVIINQPQCPPGTYGADPDRLVCDICPGGYVCLGTTITATPASAEEDGGFQCTVGHYCPEGSWEEIPCPAGSYNPDVGSSAASECSVCPADHYQVKTALVSDRTFVCPHLDPPAESS